MRLNCGDCKTVREAKERQRVENWHTIFLLWPRRMTYSDKENDCRWMERVQRRGDFLRSYGVPSHWVWEYKPL